MLDPKGWNLEKLKAWLEIPITQEDDEFELKEMIPVNDEGKSRLKKEFCAFANTKGGYVFFGVSDSKAVVGVSESDTQFQTRLEQIVTSDNVRPPTIKWGVYECIRLANNKCVYVVYVYESPYYKKPHVYFKEADGGLCIPVRDRGKIRHVTHGTEIREILLKVDRFYPEYIGHIFDIVNSLKGRVNLQFSLTESNLIRGYKSHLRDYPITDSAKIISSLEAIEGKVKDINKAIYATDDEGRTVSGSAIEELEKLISRFLTDFGGHFK